ncbi:MAG TPA: hypothetical protein VJL82_04000 [Rhizomicrobium sp.]|nr:hypothetical protein [Rhizomicrobium sp.]
MLVVLAGCAAPMTGREAQGIARERLVRYCGGQCGGLALGKTQRIKDRWLVDFDAPRQKFTVIVENNGNAKVTTWNK